MKAIGYGSCLVWALLCLLPWSAVASTTSQTYGFSVVSDDTSDSNESDVESHIDLLVSYDDSSDSDSSTGSLAFTISVDAESQGTVTEIAIYGAGTKDIWGTATLSATGGTVSMKAGDGIAGIGFDKASYSYDLTKNGALENGISPGESFTMTFSSQDVTQAQADALFSGLDSGSIVVAIHVQDFTDGGSAKAVSAVPIPAAAWLLGSGLLGWTAIRRKFTGCGKGPWPGGRGRS